MSGEHTIGQDVIQFNDVAADPTVAGELQRNGANLKFHDGTAARTLLHNGTPRRETRVATVNYNDASPKALFTVQNGDLVTGVWCRNTTVWNGGASESLQIGDGSDADGFIYLDQVELASSPNMFGRYHDERGAYLWDSAVGHDIDHQYSAADTIDATITPDGATQGVTLVYCEILRLL